jgi:hypothetical protein
VSQRGFTIATAGFAGLLAFTLLFLDDIFPETDGLPAVVIDSILAMWTLWCALGALGIQWIVDPGAPQRLMQAAPVVSSYLLSWIGGLTIMGMAYLATLIGTVAISPGTSRSRSCRCSES